MRLFISIFLLCAIVDQAKRVLSDDPSCSSSGGNDDGLGVSVNCVEDGNDKGPFPNFAKVVNGLTVFSANASADVNIEPMTVESLTYEGSASDIPDNAFASFGSLRDLNIDCSRSLDKNGVGPAVTLKKNAFKGLEWRLKRLRLFGLNLNGAGGVPAAIRPLSALEVLILEDCNLKGELKGEDLKQFKNLRHLEIKNSPQLSIADDCFSNNADSLEKIVLDNVKMTVIPKSVSALKVLRDMEIRRTAVSAVPAVFHTSTLKELRLSDNAISSIDAGAFKGLSGCVLLSLSGNQISSLPSGLFDDLVLCESLQLNGNRLTTASTENAFKRMNKLKELSLGENQLESITPGTLAGIENSATWLYFSGNNIKSVRGTSKLTQSPQMYLASNDFSSLAPGAIESGSKFSTLDLDSNPIGNIQSGCFNGIAVGRSFSLSDTALVEIDLSSLSGMQGVENLTISSNSDLKTIKVSSESAVPSTLKYIICENNPRLLLSDGGKLPAYLRKSNVKIIVRDQLYCQCQLGWLRGKTGAERNVQFVTISEAGDVTPTRCCNVDASVEDYLTDSVYKEQCPAGAAKGKKNPEIEEESC